MARLSEMKRSELGESARDKVAVIPVGSLEQHGEHLPLGTDSLIVEQIVTHGLASRKDVAVCPTVPYGYSGHHGFAGAMTLSPRTLLSVYEELIDSLVSMGFRRILVVNGHGGNQEMISQAVKLATLNNDVICACANYWDLVDAIANGPGHAGAFETNLVRSIAPNLVGNRPIGPSAAPLFDNPPAPGMHVERHGEWAHVGGVTDNPDDSDDFDAADYRQRVEEALSECVDALLRLPLIDTADAESHTTDN